MPTSTTCIAPTDLASHRDRVRVVDVRTPGEFESVHIPGARNVPLDRLADHTDTLRDWSQDDQVVLVCRSGARAHQAQEELAVAGLPRLPILEGGVLAWEAAGLDVVRDRLRWDLERQVRLVAGLIVATAILVSVVWPPARFVAGAVGVGLVFAAVTNTCTMGLLLAKLPYNRAGAATTTASTVGSSAASPSTVSSRTVPSAS